MRIETRDETILRSITREYRTKIYSKFLAAIDKYQLIKNGDKICVCISGGKDSMLLAECFRLFHKSSKLKFDVTYLVMNPGYNELNINLINKNLKTLNINAEVVNTNIFDIAYIQENSPCYLCARMRRGALYRLAKERGCNKIALGHHYDDIIETTLMNLLYSGSFQTMLPKLYSDNFENMELIRPFYFVREKDIIAWSKDNKLKFLNCACKFTEENYSNKNHSNSKRLFTKQLIKKLSKNHDVDKNIFASTNNVIIDKVLAYKKDGKIISFLDNYDSSKRKQSK